MYLSHAGLNVPLTRWTKRAHTNLHSVKAGTKLLRQKNKRRRESAYCQIPLASHPQQHSPQITCQEVELREMQNPGYSQSAAKTLTKEAETGTGKGKR